MEVIDVNANEAVAVKPEREINLSEFKVQVNNLIWMYAPESVTLGKADEIALQIVAMIRQGRVTPL